MPFLFCLMALTKVYTWEREMRSAFHDYYRDGVASSHGVGWSFETIFKKCGRAR